MKKCSRVVVCDDSLYMAGIATSLKADLTLEVLCINFGIPDSQQYLYENDLDAIIFDLGAPPVCLDVTVFRNRPELVLIGVEPSSDEMLILSSYPTQARNIADLVNVIHQNKTAPVPSMQKSLIKAADDSF